LNIPDTFSDAILEVELYNSLGQKVYKKVVNSYDNKLQVADLPKGLYNVVLKSPSNKETIFSTKLTKI
jgi:hypothetical protein